MVDPEKPLRLSLSIPPSFGQDSSMVWAIRQHHSPAVSTIAFGSVKQTEQDMALSLVTRPAARSRKINWMPEPEPVVEDSDMPDFSVIVRLDSPLVDPRDVFGNLMSNVGFIFDLPVA